MTFGITKTLNNLQIGDKTTVPLSKLKSVKTTASTMKLLDNKGFKTKQLNDARLVQVTRVY